MKQPDPNNSKKALAKKKANRKDSEGRSGMGYTETGLDKLNRIYSNPQNSQVTSNLPSVDIANRRDMGPELVRPQEYGRESYVPGMSGGGRTFVRSNGDIVDPKYLWLNARNAAAKKKK